MKYEKPPLSNNDHINLLSKRGLIINDKSRVERYLNVVGYYRLSGYMYHLQLSDGTHKFIEGTSFEDIVTYYKFDKKLRMLFLDYLERIEVTLRTQITDCYSLDHGFFWYRDGGLFKDGGSYNMVNDEIDARFNDAQDRFLKSFKHKYSSEDLPPSNMAMELLTFGRLIKLFRGLDHSPTKKRILDFFGLPNSLLVSWLVYLSNIRNICAHHSRLWNRRLTADRPKIPSRKKFQFKGTITPDMDRTLYGTSCLLDRLLFNTCPGNSFTIKLTSLIKEYEQRVDLSKMGFPTDWETNAPWIHNTISDSKTQPSADQG